MVRARLLVSAVLVAGFVGVAAGSAAAATIKVTTTFDDQSQGDGQCSLRKAILDVNSPGNSQTDCAPAAFGANTIVLPAGGYQLGGGPNSPGQLTIASTVTNLTITGASESGTTIDAGPLNDRALMISGGAGVTITNLSIVNASAQGGAGTTQQSGSDGGAILNHGTLTISNAAITNSHAGNGGAGDSGTTATGGAGGSGGAVYSTGSLTLNGATISSNTAGDGGAGGGGLQPCAGTQEIPPGTGGPGGNGGGIENAGGTLTVIASTIRGNTAGNGGTGGVGGPGINNCIGGGGGGQGGTGGNGGGVWSDGGSMSVTNSTFASNSSGAGATGGSGGAGTGTSVPGAEGGPGGPGGSGGSAGGIGASSPSSASILQATAAGNNAGAGGTGGTGGNGSPSGNAGAAGLGGAGGGILGQGTAITLRNSLLALSVGGNCSGLIQDGGFNLSFGDSSCPSTFSSADPDLGPLQDNGGPAATISLQPGSAAIDQIPAAGANCPATDERGAPRPNGSSSSKCDIGAYEVVPPVGVTQPAANIGRSGATIAASVTPYAGLGVASVVFQYGTTTKYGKTTGIQRLGGVAATPVTAKLSGLKPNTAYHYRVVVIAMDGTVTGTDATFTTSVTPAVTGLSIKPKSFSAAGGAMVSYKDSRGATSTLTALRCAQMKRGRCVRFTKFASFTHKDVAGPNKVKIKGRFGRRALQRGSYRLALMPRANGKAGKTVTATFTVT